MRPSSYKELPEEKAACFGVEPGAACAGCWDTHPDLARLCVEIRAGTTADGYIKIKGHDPIRVTRNEVTGGPVYQVEPEVGARPPAVAEVRRALIFAERADYEPPALLLGTVTRKLFPDASGWMKYPELFADERQPKTATQRRNKQPGPDMASAGDTLF